MIYKKKEDLVFPIFFFYQEKHLRNQGFRGVAKESN